MLFILIVLISYFAATFSYFLYDATDVIELTSTFFQSLTAIAIITNYLVHFWKTPAVLDLIEKFDEFIVISKFGEFLEFKK